MEVLVELRDALAAELVAQGKDEWARQEFAAVLSAGPPPPRPDPWRRTSGIHRVRTRRGLAIVRELWLERDKIARRRDLSPGRVLPDSAIVEAARAAPATVAELTTVPGFKGRGARRHIDEWFGAIRRAHAEADQALPRPAGQVSDGPPPAHRWQERDPVAAQRLAAVRTAIAALADEHSLPAENLVQPDAVRRLAWQPPAAGERRGGGRPHGRLRRPALAGGPHLGADRRGPAPPGGKGRRVAPRRSPGPACRGHAAARGRRGPENVGRGA